jgi:GT2 family glycosyltransferase
MMHRHVAVVILGYNSDKDIPVCAELLGKQTDIHFTIIIVDNNSATDSSERTKSWLATWRIDAITGLQEEVHAWIMCNSDRANESGSVYFVRNHENRGYSAGNNIGARLAVSLGYEAVLIINPDVRITDQYYLCRLADKLFSDDRYVVAASAIRNLSGANENPMHELGFIEELFWPFWMTLSRFGVSPPSQRVQVCDPCRKVSGSCLLIRSSFLEDIGYFDEGVFLYCEEAILSVQIRNAGKKIAYVPELEALHAHLSSTKGLRTLRMKEWVKSRGYYHQHHTSYGAFRRLLLRFSHYSTLGLMKLQDLLAKKS